MGFRAPSYKLTFEGDPAFEGLEVQIRAPSVQTILDLGDLEDVKAKLGDKQIGESMLKLLAGSIVSWNLEDYAGNPVPVTAENVLAQEFPMLVAITEAFEKLVLRITKVPPPLRNGSGNPPGTLASLQIPMEPMTANPGN